MASGSYEIYKTLVQDSDDNWLLGLLSFAAYEERRIEWMSHFNDTEGRHPTDEEVANWYRQQSSGEIVRSKDTASTRLRDYAEEIIRSYSQEEIDKIKESLLYQEISDTKHSVISKLSASNSWLKQFGAGVAASVVGAFVTALLVFLSLNLMQDNHQPLTALKELAGDQTDEKQE